MAKKNPPLLLIAPVLLGLLGFLFYLGAKNVSHLPVADLKVTEEGIELANKHIDVIWPSGKLYIGDPDEGRVYNFGKLGPDTLLRIPYADFSNLFGKQEQVHVEQVHLVVNLDGYVKRTWALTPNEVVVLTKPQ